MTSAHANTRRWMRHEVDLPVRVFARGISQAVLGRGTELSAGGMALYAGLELRPSQTLEVEFVAASHARVAGVVRSREGYRFGLEFTTPLPIGGDSRGEVPWPGTKLEAEPGPLSQGAHELFQKIKAARGNAAAYALLAKVLVLAGRRPEARNAADRALAYFQQESYVRHRQRQQDCQQLLMGLQTVRDFLTSLMESCDDPNTKRITGSLRPPADR
ncbi:MAG: PilZ domain-containing protein [Terriglobales bacterium]